LSRHPKGQLLAGTGLSLGAALGMTASAQANTFEVDTAFDPAVIPCTAAVADCSLRGALANSNASNGTDDVITFASSMSGQTITLGSELFIDDAVTITGPGAGALTISGSDMVRILRVDVEDPGEDVTLSGVTLRDGAAGQDIHGGGVYNRDSDFTLADSVITSGVSTHFSSQGGGFYDGGLSPSNGFGTTILRSTITGNTAGFGGGGVWADEGINVIGSTISGNSVTPVSGGGLLSLGYAYVYSSTISGNHAPGFGGGIYGVAGGGGDGLLSNTIVANNTSGTVAADVRGDWYTDFALIENIAGATLTPGSGTPTPIVGDPMLGPLAANGGPTPTLKPSPGSLAVDRGRSTLPIDQRGSPRLFDAPAVPNAGNGVDLGAVELQAGDFVVPAAPKKKKCKKKKKKKRTAAAAKKCKKKKKK
jgi:hypothetical protein